MSDNKPDVRFASKDHPRYKDADKEHIREWIQESCWIIAESFGADRTCEGCRTVMRRLDRRQHDGSTCMMHGFKVPFIPDSPNPWTIAFAEAKGTK